MENRKLERGDVVQLKPEHKYGCMLLVIDEPMSFGCQGYLMSQLNFDAVKVGGVAYIRANFDEFEYVGKVVWFWESDHE